MQVRHEHHLKSEGREWGSLHRQEESSSWLVCEQKRLPSQSLAMPHSQWSTKVSVADLSLLVFLLQRSTSSTSPACVTWLFPTPEGPQWQLQMSKLKIQSRLGKKFCSWAASSSVSGRDWGLGVLAGKNIRNLHYSLIHSLIHPSLSPKCK